MKKFTRAQKNQRIHSIRYEIRFLDYFMEKFSFLQYVNKFFGLSL